MKFSVIIPLYNKAPYVAKAVQSVLSQTLDDYELVIVDDGSTDQSAKIASKAIEGHDNCRMIRQENEGVSMARNNGVAISYGDYLCFLDADDWWNPCFLEEMAGLIAEFPDAGIYGTNYTIVNETKHKTRIAPIVVEPGFEKGYINYCQVYAKTLAMPLTSISVAMPRHVFEATGGFPEGITLGEDFLLWIRIALKYKVVFLNKPLAFYNQDVDVASRGINNNYSPDTFMTFFFDQFMDDEAKNQDLKILLDRLRVHTLLYFRLNNLYPERVQTEIAKVDFSNVDAKYKLYYRAPLWAVKIHHGTAYRLSKIKNIILK